MNILAFDTSFDCCSAAAARGLRGLSPVISSFAEPMSAGHAERLVPMIAETLAETSLEVGDLDCIAVTVGPGTFTGTRIALSAARALALVAEVPFVAITSLRLMAMNREANATGARELVIATDARRGEVYFERFDPHSLRSRAPAAALPVAVAAASLGPGAIVIAGSGAEALAQAARDLGREARAVAPGLLPDALDMLFAAMSLEATRTLNPLYLRPPDAKPQMAGQLLRSPA